MKASVVWVLAAALAGCATSYQSSGLSGGFSDVQLDTNVFRVSFQGNGYTRPDAVAEMTLLRSAELALKHGFTHFAIADSSSQVRHTAFTTPTTTTTSGTLSTYGNTGQFRATSMTTGGQMFVAAKPSATNTIVCFQGKPEIGALVYDARFIFQSLGAKYGVKGDPK